jgi:hypothetical protein
VQQHRNMAGPNGIFVGFFHLKPGLASGGGGHGIYGGDLAAWLLLRRQITDREYRLALRAAATKSASRSLRTYTAI